MKLEDDTVCEQDGIKDYLEKEKDTLSKLSKTGDRATISMSITINDVDRKVCGHFLWDLAHKAIRDKFKFDFDVATAHGPLHGSGQIAVDEFEAHRTIVSRIFKYLAQSPRDETKTIGMYLLCWLPYHLQQLHKLEDDGQGELMPSEKLEIGQNLHSLFKDDEVIRRHKATFEQVWWSAQEIKDLQKWLTDSAVVRRVDKKWRDEVQLAVPTKGFIKEFVKVVVEGLLRERSWEAFRAYNWIEEFMLAVSLSPRVGPLPWAMGRC